MISLTAAYDPGDKDPGQTYPYVQGVKVNQALHPTERMSVKWCYGTVVDSEFVEGKEPVRAFKVTKAIWDARIDGYTSAGGGEKSWKAWDVALHQCLLDEAVVARH